MTGHGDDTERFRMTLTRIFDTIRDALAVAGDYGR